jgi:hypothetical protein
MYVSLYKFFLFPTALFEKLRAPQLVKKFPAFYAPGRFIAVCIRALPLSLS